MTSADLIFQITQQAWSMTRHTVCRLCSRYRPTNDDRVCRPCMERHVAHALESSADADTETHTEENE